MSPTLPFFSSPSLFFCYVYAILPGPMFICFVWTHTFVVTDLFVKRGLDANATLQWPVGPHEWPATCHFVSFHASSTFWLNCSYRRFGFVTSSLGLEAKTPRCSTKAVLPADVSAIVACLRLQSSGLQRFCLLVAHRLFSRAVAYWRSCAL